MKRKIFISVAVALAMLGGPMLASAQITGTTTVSSQIQALLDQVKNLQALVQTLQAAQAQVKAVKGDIQETIKLTRQLRKGMTSDEVVSLQEILAADPSIYPEGLVTGYFGQLTENAVKKFQKKHGIEQLGEVGPKTKAALYGFLGTISTSTAKLPPGLAKKLNVGWASTTASTTASSLPGATVTICHFPPGNQAAKQTITIGAPAVSAHLRHGDVIGACTGATTPTASTTPDIVAPVISGVNTSALLATTTNVVWTTDEPANSKVSFGTSTPIVTTSVTVVSSSDLVTSHNLSLSDLATSTTYYYVVESADASGNTATSSQYSFTTLAQ